MTHPGALAPACDATWPSGQHHDQAPSPGPAPGSAAHAPSPPPGSPPAGRTAPSSESTSAPAPARTTTPGSPCVPAPRRSPHELRRLPSYSPGPFPLSGLLGRPLIRRIRCGPRITRLLRTVSGACCRQGGGGAADRTSAKGCESNHSTQQALPGGAHEAPLNLQIARSLTPAPVTSQQQHHRGAPRV